MSNPIFIGSCGWSYPGWKGNFYPSKTKQADFLTEYAKRFSVVEVDSTYYHCPSPKTVEGWNAKTPDAFSFCLKVPQAITHEKLLTDCDREVEQFTDAVRLLGHKLRCCVLQLPFCNQKAFSSLDAFIVRLRSFLAAWPTDVPIGVEIRNAKWVGRPFAACLRSHNATWVLADIIRMPSVLRTVEQIDPVTSSFAYVRLIGNRAEVDALTAEFEKIVVDRSAEIVAVADAIQRLAKRVPVYVAVNNHYAGYAPETIKELSKRLGITVAEPDDDDFFGVMRGT